MVEDLHSPSIQGIHHNSKNLIVIEDMHDSGPGTYQRGTVPIDEMFLSFNIKVKTAGCLDHGHIRSGHRTI